MSMRVFSEIYLFVLVLVLVSCILYLFFSFFYYTWYNILPYRLMKNIGSGVY